MTKRNPYKVIEKTLKIVGWTLYGLFLAIALVASGVGAYALMGWWALLVVPGIPAGMLLLLLIGVGFDSLAYRWGNKRIEWEWKNRE